MAENVISEFEDIDEFPSANPPQDGMEINVESENTRLSNVEFVKEDGEESILGCLFEEQTENILTENSEMDVEAASTSIIQVETEIVENEDDLEMQQLTLQLQQKFTNPSLDQGCFPQNPMVEENLRYIDFYEPTVEGRIGLLDWCTCGNCVVMTTNIESICCREIENAAPYLPDLQCICEHEYFPFYCSRPETVRINSRGIADFNRPPPQRQENRHLRKTAYRMFTAWIHGYLGKGNRRPIPSCVVKRVRQAFPDPQASYTGFSYPSDYPAEIMAFE